MENEMTTEQCNSIIDMKIEGSSLSTLWQSRQLAEKSQFSADIKHTGFDRRLGRLMVFIHSQYPDRKTLSRKIYTDYGIEGISSQRRSEAKSFEELGEEKGTEKYEELDTRYENKFDQIRNRVQARIKELKN